MDEKKNKNFNFEDFFDNDDDDVKVIGDVNNNNNNNGDKKVKKIYKKEKKAINMEKINDIRLVKQSELRGDFRKIDNLVLEGYRMCTSFQ